MVEVWDHDNLNQDDFMGQVMIPLREVSTIGPKEEWFPLTRRSGKERVSGSILLEMHLKVDKNKVSEAGFASGLASKTHFAVARRGSWMM